MRLAASLVCAARLPGQIDEAGCATARKLHRPPLSSDLDRRWVGLRGFPRVTTRPLSCRGRASGIGICRFTRSPGRRHVES